MPGIRRNLDDPVGLLRSFDTGDPIHTRVVRLNTEEIGRVVAVNRNHPLRPRVEVVADSKGHRLPAPKVIDLSEAPFLYITGPVTEGGR